jgi:DNA repair exonuclease SbcCD ATPase subunit
LWEKRKIKNDIEAIKRRLAKLEECKEASEDDKK